MSSEKKIFVSLSFLGLLVAGVQFIVKSQSADRARSASLANDTFDALQMDIKSYSPGEVKLEAVSIDGTSFSRKVLLKKGPPGCYDTNLEISWNSLIGPRTLKYKMSLLEH